MRLYADTSEKFIQDTVQNQISEKLRLAFFHQFRYQPAQSEINSWRNSLRCMCQVIEYAKLLYHGIILEYQLPLSSRRLDCLICGRDSEGRDNAVVVELKQWQDCQPTESDKLLTFVGGGNREVLHPSVQVHQYKEYLRDVHTAFYDGDTPISLDKHKGTSTKGRSPN